CNSYPSTFFTYPTGHVLWIDSVNLRLQVPTGVKPMIWITGFGKVAYPNGSVSASQTPNYLTATYQMTSSGTDYYEVTSTGRIYTTTSGPIQIAVACSGSGSWWVDGSMSGTFVK
ncbi:MAG: hypothetical protein ACTHJM_02960, partial [Marmoricola sp.]